MRYSTHVMIKNREISISNPTYFIADVAANHDGDLGRAKDLIYRAKDAGLDAVKFQHFTANKIVSDRGFKMLGGPLSHQAGWNKSVFEIYRQYECDRNWSQELAETANKADIHFFTSPYDDQALNLLDRYMPAYKIGSGDITYTGFISHIAKLGKPTLLATGASTFEDVERAVETILTHNRQIVLMQCNTNYTGSLENFKHINLRVLQAYAIQYPGMVLGLSDHTPGHATVLGAIALGARVVEKHFTDDNSRIGPDHPFSLTPRAWTELIERSRELENALGNGVKRVEENEIDTFVVQRRCLRLVRPMHAGELLQNEDLESLRPAPMHSYPPYRIDQLVGKQLAKDKEAGDALMAGDFGEN